MGVAPNFGSVLQRKNVTPYSRPAQLLGATPTTGQQQRVYFPEFTSGLYYVTLAGPAAAGSTVGNPNSASGSPLNFGVSIGTPGSLTVEVRTGSTSGPIVASQTFDVKAMPVVSPLALPVGVATPVTITGCEPGLRYEISGGLAGVSGSGIANGSGVVALSLTLAQAGNSFIYVETPGVTAPGTRIDGIDFTAA